MQFCRSVRPEKGPFQDTNLPQLMVAGKTDLMMSKTSSVLAAALFAALSAAAAAATGVVDDSSRPLEFPAEAERLVAATAALFADLERVEVPKMEKPTIIGTPQPVGLSVAAEVEARPEIKHLIGYRVSWYPVETLLGTVDFVGTYDVGQNLVCGYVTWDLDDPNNTEMVALQTNFVDLDELNAMSKGERHLALIEANCAFGEIEPNFALSLGD